MVRYSDVSKAMPGDRHPLITENETPEKACHCISLFLTRQTLTLCGMQNSKGRHRVN